MGFPKVQFAIPVRQTKFHVNVLYQVLKEVTYICFMAVRIPYNRMKVVLAEKSKSNNELASFLDVEGSTTDHSVRRSAFCRIKPPWELEDGEIAFPRKWANALKNYTFSQSALYDRN
jgi:hypothetical protein